MSVELRDGDRAFLMVRRMYPILDTDSPETMTERRRIATPGFAVDAQTTILQFCMEHGFEITPLLLSDEQRLRLCTCMGEPYKSEEMERQGLKEET